MSNPTASEQQEAHDKGGSDASEHWTTDRGWDLFDTYSRYDPPNDPDLKESYDQGWHNTESQIFR